MNKYYTAYCKREKRRTPHVQKGNLYFCLSCGTAYNENGDEI